MKWRSILFRFGMVGASMGCADTGDRAEWQFAVQDSAGVILTDLPADLSSLGLPSLIFEEKYQVGSDRSGLQSFRVSGARFMADGRLVIADAGTLDLALVDSFGQIDSTIGREGEGPGEFRSISSAHVTDDGAIVVFDDLLGRVTEFDGAGRLVTTGRRIEPHPGLDIVPLIASSSGPLVAVYGDNRMLGRGPIFHDTTPLLRYDATAARPDTLSLWRTKIWSLTDVGIGGLRVEVAFGPDLLSFGQTDRFALADTHEPSVSILDENGTLVMKVRWGETAKAVTTGDVEKFRAKRATQLSDGLPDAVRKGYLDVPAHETRPVLNAIALDRDGDVWIAPASLSDTEMQTWLVIDRLGSVRGEVRLPFGSRILDVRSDWVAALSQDRYDRDIVTVYGMR